MTPLTRVSHTGMTFVFLNLLLLLWVSSCWAFLPLPLARSTAGAFTSTSTTSTLLSNSNNNNNEKLDKGFNLLGIAGKVVPQGVIVSTVKESWRFAWSRMMAELAPQDSKGAYQRPGYEFQERIGSQQFPDEPGRYHLYVGNPCPVSTERNETKTNTK